MNHQRKLRWDRRRRRLSDERCKYRYVCCRDTRFMFIESYKHYNIPDRVEIDGESWRVIASDYCNEERP